MTQQHKACQSIALTSRPPHELQLFICTGIKEGLDATIKRLRMLTLGSRTAGRNKEQFLSKPIGTRLRRSSSFPFFSLSFLSSRRLTSPYSPPHPSSRVRLSSVAMMGSRHLTLPLLTFISAALGSTFSRKTRRGRRYCGEILLVCLYLFAAPLLAGPEIPRGLLHQLFSGAQ